MQPHLDALYHAREVLMSRGLTVLGLWALGNLLISGYYLAQSDRRYPPHHFHGMNVMWGAINAGLAAWSVLHLHTTSTPPGLTISTFLSDQLSLERIFLFNAGLDVAYVATGFYLVARAAVPATPRPARLLGFGRSLWLQGGFLLLFDAAMFGLLLRFSELLLARV